MDKHQDHRLFSQIHSQECGCEQSHDHNWMRLRTRWLLSLATVGILFLFLRPFLIEKMFTRANDYSLYGDNYNEVRICKKIVAIDRYDVLAWTRLGFAFIDGDQPQSAFEPFAKAISINPQDKPAAFYELGQAYFLKKDFNQAIKYFQLVKSMLSKEPALSDTQRAKYRHETSGFQKTYDMGTLFKILKASYILSGDMFQAAKVEKEYKIYINKNKMIFF